MNELQTKIADKILNIIAKNNSRISKDDLHYHLDEGFGYKAGNDISYVLDALENDYRLIAPLGNAWIRLTLEGENAEKTGISQYFKNLHADKESDKSVKTSTVRSYYFNITNVCITVASAIIASLNPLEYLN